MLAERQRRQRHTIAQSPRNVARQPAVQHAGRQRIPGPRAINDDGGERRLAVKFGAVPRQHAIGADAHYHQRRPGPPRQRDDSLLWIAAQIEQPFRIA